MFCGAQTNRHILEIGELLLSTDGALMVSVDGELMVSADVDCQCVWYCRSRAMWTTLACRPSEPHGATPFVQTAAHPVSPHEAGG